jgi:glucose/arabinose dehydrogenase
VLESFPDPNPPKPFVSFQAHVAANGFDFCRDANFGFEGDAFVACFGDLAPITTLADAATPAGFKVVRVNMQEQCVEDFAVNKIQGPASKLPHDGFERPSHCQFGPDGSLYVVDFGIIHIAPEKGGIRQQIGTGSLWRIRRTQGPQGSVPPKPLTIPLYLLQGVALLVGIVGTIGAGILLVRKLLGRRGGKR